MGVGYSLLDTYRSYDICIRDVLAEFKVDYGTISGERKSRCPILIIMSTPERAFAKMYQVLVRKGWVAGVTEEQILDNAYLYKNVPLPFISIQRRDATIDFGRSKAPFIFEGFEKFKDGTVVDHPHPVPYDYNYDVTFWCKNQFSAIYFQEWIQAIVGDRGAAPQEFFRYVNMGVWGNQLHGIRMEAVFETSKNSGILYDFRDYTYMSSLVIKGWMFKQPDYENRKNSIILQEKIQFTEESQVTPSERVNIFTSVVTRNLLERINKAYYPQILFDTTNADIAIDSDSHDGRYTVDTPYIGGTPPSYKITFTDTDGAVITKILNIHSYQTTLAIRCAFKREAGGSAYFNVKDKDEVIVRQIEIPQVDGWQQAQEFFVKLDSSLYLEFKGNSEDLYVDILGAYIREGLRGETELIVDSDMTASGVTAWTAEAAGALSKVTVDGDQALRVGTSANGDGVSQSIEVDKIGLYILSVDILEASTVYTVKFTNGTQTEEIVTSAYNTKLSLIMFTMKNLQVIIEQNGSSGYVIVDDIQVRSFFSAPLLQI